MHTIRDGGWVRIRTGKIPYTYTYEAHGSASTMYGYVFRTHCIRLWPSLSISHRTTYMPLPIYVLAAHTARVTQWIHVVCGCCLAASSNTRFAATSLHACTHKHTHTRFCLKAERLCVKLLHLQYAGQHTNMHRSIHRMFYYWMACVRTLVCVCVCSIVMSVYACVNVVLVRIGSPQQLSLEP